MCLPYVKRYFQEHQWIIFFLYGSNNRDSVVFGNAAFEEIKDHSLKTTTFQKKFIYGSFWFVSDLRKKVFSGALMKYFCLYGSNNSYSVVFGNVDFAEIIDHSLRMTPFHKKIINVSFAFVSTLCKNVVSGVPGKCFSLYGSNNSDSVVSGYANIAEIKDHSFRKSPFQKKLCYQSFRYVSTLHKKVCWGAPVKGFCLYSSNNLNSIFLGNAPFGKIKDHSFRTSLFQKKTLLSKFYVCVYLM